MKCLVHGCTNDSYEGEMVGNLCVPCYNTITTGKVKYGATFIHDMRDEVEKNKRALQEITKLVEMLS